MSSVLPRPVLVGGGGQELLIYLRFTGNNTDGEVNLHICSHPFFYLQYSHFVGMCGGGLQIGGSVHQMEQPNRDVW